jgi:hypothetical protein
VTLFPACTLYHLTLGPARRLGHSMAPGIFRKARYLANVLILAEFLVDGRFFEECVLAKLLAFSRQLSAHNG